MPTLLMKHLRLKGHYSRVPCEATAHPGEEVLSSFCDSQGGASFWGVAAAGAEMSQTRGSSWGNREQESVKQVVALFHGADSRVWMSQLCKKEPFLLSSFGHRVCTCVCGHWFALVLCCVTYSPLPTHTHRHTHTHRSLQRSLHRLSFPCEVLLVPQPLRSNLRKHFLCIGLHYEHFTNMNLLSSHKILKGRYYYHPHFTDEDSETEG